MESDAQKSHGGNDGNIALGGTKRQMTIVQEGQVAAAACTTAPGISVGNGSRALFLTTPLSPRPNSTPGRNDFKESNESVKPPASPLLHRLESQDDEDDKVVQANKPPAPALPEINRPPAADRSTEQEPRRSEDRGNRTTLSGKSRYSKLLSSGKRTRPLRTAVVQDLANSVGAYSGSGNHQHRNKRKRKESSATATTPPPAPKVLPPHQYETTLVRRAIRPGEAPPDEKKKTANLSKSGTVDDSVLDVYGDVSLGMQFQLAEGKYIVKGLISLKDGRASPAQLTGCIQRGDVLLQINNQSLVNIPPYRFMEIVMRLLATPLGDGSYPRKIKLRFAAGQGLEMLERSEEEAQRKVTGAGGGFYHGPNLSMDGIDGAADVLGLFSFAMVDQLSGMPMFVDHNSSVTTPPPAITQQPEPQIKAGPVIPSETKLESAPETTKDGINQSVKETPQQARSVSLEEAISRLIAQERQVEREECDSEFFSWNDSLSHLLRRPSWTKTMKASPVSVYTDDGRNGSMDKTEILELGHEAFKGARKLAAILEKIDRGWSDRRSLHSLSATLSLYSKASTRRRYVLDSKAMPVNFEKLQEEEESDQAAAPNDEGSSAGSNEEEEEEEDLNADDYLLRLAAQDEIWKKQVIDFLEDVVEKLSNPEDGGEGGNSSMQENDNGAATTVSTELGSFLFGDRISKALMLHKKPQALPPDEITALLFDLITNVSATVPDQIHAVGNNATVRSAVVPFITMKKPSANSDVMLASRFLLDEVLPVWLKTFRPLPWEQRRVMWPLEKSSADSTTAGSTRSDDSMTVDSMSTRPHSPTKKKKVKNLREQIEDQELNVQTREETRFMVTFYFTQKLLPQLLRDKGPSQSAGRVTIDENALQAAKVFVQDYGAYLRLHTCIAYAAVLKAQDIIEILLDLGKHDPQHRESLRRFSRPNALYFYEPATLSAVVERLRNLKKESNPEQRLKTIQICAQAYPDVRPWQVDRECRGLWRTNPNTRDKEHLNELYYKYLSYLLHPMEGQEEARHDSALVTEWAELSVRGYLEQQKKLSKNMADIKERKRNFHYVASKAASYHTAYTRDLTKLLALSMEAREYPLALDLATEILEDERSRTEKKSLFNSIMFTLRTIGLATIESFDPNNEIYHRSLKRIFRLFQRANGMGPPDNPWVVEIPTEIAKLLAHASRTYGTGNRETLISLVQFISNSKEAGANELLLALAKWMTTSPSLKSDLYPVLRTILKKGAQTGSSSVAELSISLQRVRQARSFLHSEKSDVLSSLEGSPSLGASEGVGLWKKMSRGRLPLAK